MKVKLVLWCKKQAHKLQDAKAEKLRRSQKEQDDVTGWLEVKNVAKSSQKSPKVDNSCQNYQKLLKVAKNWPKLPDVTQKMVKVDSCDQKLAP